MAKQKVSELNLKDKIVYVGRTAKVVKGGRRFNFSAMVVVGDEAGHVGYGLVKAVEVSEAEKAISFFHARFNCVCAELVNPFV